MSHSCRVERSCGISIRGFDTLERFQRQQEPRGSRGARNYCPPGALSLCQLVFYHSADVYFEAVFDSFSATEATVMKADIHPTYATATVKCACGNEFTTRSTQSEIHTDICGNCHPFYTGKQKLIDTAGRVERFRQKYGKPA
jgi:large subunit ribosomal protein L31